MNINGDNTSDNITNGIITNSTTNGTFNIKCDDNTYYDLQTPNNGNNTDVLKTDGNGNTYWDAGGGGPGSNPTLQDVYDNSSNPANVVLVNNKPIIFKDVLDQVAFTISSDGTTTAAGGIEGGFYKCKMNTIQRADIGDTKIEVIEDIPLTTIRTTFTENQEFITKLYADSIPPSNPFDQTLNIIDDVIFNGISSFDTTGLLQFDELYPKIPGDLNLGTQNTDIVRIGGDGIFIQSANIYNVNTNNANSFVKSGGTSSQYLMADGSSLQYSQNSGNSNSYLYDNSDNITIPPPPNGHIGYNNATQQNATIIYISHLTSDNIDIDIFFTQLTQIQDVYIQDKNSSLNFIKYNITGTPTIVVNSYISIPVLYTASIPPQIPNGAGTGLTSFGNNHPLIISFFTNSIEVDTRLSLLEEKTQYITTSGSGEVTNIVSLVLTAKSIQSYLAGAVFSIGGAASVVAIEVPMTINGSLTTQNVLCNVEGAYDIGALGNQFRRGYFTTALRCPVYDSATFIPVNLGTSNASAVNIGSIGITSTILGTTNINNVYTLPNTAPSVGQVMTCGSLGVANWITPTANSFSSVYPFPTSIRTITLGPGGTRTLCATYTMTANITFTTASLFFSTPGTDINRVGIYRGDLTTATLVGQTSSNAPSSDYTTRPLTLVVGQSLTFTIGQQISVAVSVNGGSTTLVGTTNISNIALAFTSTTSYSAAGFPATMLLITPKAATTSRQCIDLL